MMEKSKSERQYLYCAKKLPLITHWLLPDDLIGQEEKTKRPGYFDFKWDTIVADLGTICDRVGGFDTRLSKDQEEKQSHFLMAQCPDYVHIYVNGSYRDNNDRGGSSFYITQLNVRHGIMLEGALSPLSCELYAIRQALKFITDTQITRAIILTDSLTGLNKLMDRMKNLENEKLIFEIVDYIRSIISQNK